MGRRTIFKRARVAAVVFMVVVAPSRPTTAPAPSIEECVVDASKTYMIDGVMYLRSRSTCTNTIVEEKERATDA